MYQLRDYQRAAIDSCFEYLCNEKGNPLIVLPTGSGKSVVQAGFISEMISQYNLRFLVLQHRKELVQQNYEKLYNLIPDNVSMGCYAASFNKKQLGNDVTVAMIQSIVNARERIPKIDVVMVDEAHLVSPKKSTMYGKVFESLLALNPNMRVVGLTATPFRMGTGTLMDDGGLFTDICYNADIKHLIKQGFLSSIVSKRGSKVPDLSSLKKRKGDFIQKELDDLYDDQTTRAAIEEIIHYTQDRNKCLIFCSGIAHAEKIAEILRIKGHTAESVSSNTGDLFRTQYLEDFNAGRIKFITNCDVLTTGFDEPGIDCIAMLRPTLSTGLYVQMIGRGMRISPEKENCLLLDFANNVKEHGPIDQIRVVKKAYSEGGQIKKRSEVETEKTKICTNCRAYVAETTKVCPTCKKIFPENIKHEATAHSENAISAPEEYNITGMRFVRHQKKGKPDSLKLTFVSGAYKEINEFLCFEHGGKAQMMALKKWKMLGGSLEPGMSPQTVSQAILLIAGGALNQVSKIKTKWENGFERPTHYQFKRKMGEIQYTNESNVLYLESELANYSGKSEDDFYQEETPLQDSFLSGNIIDESIYDDDIPF